VETVVRNIRDLDQADRSALERVVGHELRETQQVILNVVNLDPGTSAARSCGRPFLADVPDSWRVYEGLSDAEIDELDEAIRQRADLSRDFE
jgi:hypothetical protein